MSRLTPTIVLAIAGLAVVAGRLPSCDSVLRLNPAFAHLFTHCDCLRSEWTDWTAINRTAVPASQCPSQSTLTYQRKQQRISGECQDIVEHRIVCKFSLKIRFQKIVRGHMFQIFFLIAQLKRS